MECTFEFQLAFKINYDCFHKTHDSKLQIKVSILQLIYQNFIIRSTAPDDERLDSFKTCRAKTVE